MEASSGATKLDFNNSLFRFPETLNGSGLNEDLKKVFIVIQRTLLSGENCLRYSSFSAISGIKWKRDQIFEKVSLVNFSYFLPHFGRPPSGARIPIQL